MKVASAAVHPFDPTTNWPEPDMSVVKPERPPAPAMTDEDFATTFGEWAGWLKSAAEVKSAHVDHVVLALVSSASAAVGNTRWAVPWDGWKEPPILWGMLIGDPSAGKSPALDAALDPATLPIGQNMTLTFARTDGMTMILAAADPIAPPIEVSGTINAVDPFAGMANITHGPMVDIGMPGMTMDFAIDPSVNAGALPEGVEVTLLLKRNPDFSMTLVGIAAAAEMLQ